MPLEVGGAADERNQGEHSAFPFEYELLLPTICNNPILLVITQSNVGATCVAFGR